MGLGLVPEPSSSGSLFHVGLWGLGGSVVKLRVVDEDRGTIGLLLLHLHRDGNEYPFTTMLRHGDLWEGTGRGSGRQRQEGDAAQAQASDSRQDGDVDRSKAAYRNDDKGLGLGKDDLNDSLLPLVLIRVEDPRERGGEEDGALSTGPYFLRILLHELGHAIHYVCSGSMSMAPELITPSSHPQPHKVTQSDGSTDSSLGRPEDCGVWGDGSQLVPPPSLSAVQCPLDLKEVPSHLLEHWAKDPSCLQVSHSPPRI